MLFVTGALPICAISQSNIRSNTMTNYLVRLFYYYTYCQRMSYSKKDISINDPQKSNENETSVSLIRIIKEIIQISKGSQPYDVNLATVAEDLL